MTETVSQATAARRHAATDPSRAEVQQQLSLSLAGTAGLAIALPSFRRASWLAPGDPDALINLGIALIELKLYGQAGSAFRRVLCLIPADPDSHHGAGAAEGGCGHLQRSEIRFRRALRLRPNYVETMIRLAGTLVRLNRYPEAMLLERQSLALSPSRAPAHIDMGVIHAKLEAQNLALQCCLRGIVTEPTSVQAHVNAAVALGLLGKIDDAVALLHHATELPGAGPEPFRNLLAVMSYAITNEALRWETTRAFARRFAAAKSAHRFANSRDPERRLAVGYLSSDFYEHPVARNLAPVIESHDPMQVRVTCYADTKVVDGMTRRLQATAAEWRITAALSDDEVAEQARRDGLDVLVIVAGRFDRNRPLVASSRGAPVQMSLFDGGTSGLEEMDYLIADRTLVAAPRLRREKYVERVLRLPSLYVHAPLAEVPIAPEPPFRSHGYVTFGCFNSPMKFSDDALRLWSAVMQAMPTSRLRLKYQTRYRDPDIRARILAQLAIHPARVDFLLGGDPVGTHLQAYDDIDIALDPFPFTGSTTTWESLWMGVPVVTLLGDAFVGRLSASFLRPVGLTELIAKTPAEYLQITLALAQDPDRLARLRIGLRERVARSPLCDGRQRARQFERLYRATWRRWCGVPVFGASDRASGVPGGAGSGR